MTIQGGGKVVRETPKILSSSLQTAHFNLLKLISRLQRLSTTVESPQKTIQSCTCCVWTVHWTFISPYVQVVVYLPAIGQTRKIPYYKTLSIQAHKQCYTRITKLYTQTCTSSWQTLEPEKHKTETKQATWRINESGSPRQVNEELYKLLILIFMQCAGTPRQSKPPTR